MPWLRGESLHGESRHVSRTMSRPCAVVVRRVIACHVVAHRESLRHESRHVSRIVSRPCTMVAPCVVVCGVIARGVSSSRRGCMVCHCVVCRTV